MWRTVEGCGGQLRAGAAGAFGLDFTAVMTMAGLDGPLTPETAALFSLVLPDVELSLIKNLRKGDDE